MKKLSKLNVIGFAIAIFIGGSAANAAESLYEGALEDRIAKLEAMIESMGNKASDKANPFYGSLRVGLLTYDDDANAAGSENEIGDVDSRFGVKGSKDIGNNLEGLYRLEYGFDNSAGQFEDFYNRISYVGLKGSHGDIRIGRDWTGSYNFVGKNTDVFLLTPGSAYNKGFGYGAVGGARTGDAIHYRGKADDISFQLGAQFASGGKSTGVDWFSIAGGIDLSKDANIGAYYNVRNEGEIKADVPKISQWGISTGVSASDSIYLGATAFGQDSDEADNIGDFSAFDVAAVFNTDGMLGSGSSIRFAATNVDYDSDVNSDDYNQWQIGVRKQYTGYQLFAWYSSYDVDKTNADSDEIKIGARYDF